MLKHRPSNARFSGTAVLSVLAALAAVFYMNSACAATILVYGDSLSAAYGLDPKEGWANLLQERLKDEKLDYQVVNASISGETTSGGLSRIDATLAKSKPKIVLIELGANDGLRGLPVAQMKSNLARMIKASLAAGAKVMLIGMMMPPNYGPAYTSAFAGAFGDLAKQYRTALMPFLLEGVADRQDLFQADNMHPTAAAQPMLLDHIWPVLKPML